MSEKGLRLDQVEGAGYMLPNLLVNPGFEIWQRGTSAFTSDDIFTADEWKIKRNASDTLQIDDESSTIKGGSLSLKATKTGTNAVAYIRQGVEAYNSLEGLTLTFSVWVHTSTASGVRLFIGDYDGSEEVEYSGYHTGGGGWEQLTVTKTIRAGLTTYASYPHSFGLSIGIQLADIAVTAYIDSASLVIGNFPEGVPFIPLNPADDQTRCERFYQRGGSNAGARFSGDVTSGETYYGAAYFTTRMRVTPTVTVSNTLNVRFGATPGTLQANDYGFNEGRDAVSSGSGVFFADHGRQKTLDSQKCSIGSPRVPLRRVL